jgi:SAM-dependent methyltransferase
VPNKFCSEDKAKNSKEKIKMRKHKIYKLSLLLIVASLLVVAHGQQPQAEKKLDVPYVPTPQTVVDAMLSLAAVTKDDVVYDLGCGDGRIVITAAKKHGARGVGIDIDPDRIKEANANAKLAGVSDRVKFIEQDLFKTDFKEASVVTLYLLPDINLKLRPKLLSELKPGTRVVSHAFDMGDWKPDKTETVDGDRRVFFWTIPEKKTAKR